MNVFIRELKANMKALIIWSICMILLVASGMAKYSAYTAGGQNSKIFIDLPRTVKALLGMGSFDVTTMSGYFAMLFLYIELAVAIHAVLLGSGIIAKEERDMTAEFLMVKPVSRSVIITAKFLSALLNIVIVNAVTFASSILFVAAYNKGKSISHEITIFMLSMFIVQLIFTSLGAAVSAFVRKPKASGSISTGILLSSFVISKITDLNDKLGPLNLLSPFKYFSYADMAAGKSLNLLISALSLLLTAVFVILTYVLYRRRDLNA